MTDTMQPHWKHTREKNRQLGVDIEIVVMKDRCFEPIMSDPHAQMKSDLSMAPTLGSLFAFPKCNVLQQWFPACRKMQLVHKRFPSPQTNEMEFSHLNCDSCAA
jgi:hypothetical protein